MISGVMVVCFENERPFQGAIAELDWCFDGHFSKLMKSQTLLGARGETLYAPLLWNGKTLHFLVIGAGSRDERTQRNQASKDLLDPAMKKLDELKLSNMAISVRDWTINEEHPAVKERNLCVLN